MASATGNSKRISNDLSRRSTYELSPETRMRPELRGHPEHTAYQSWGTGGVTVGLTL